MMAALALPAMAQTWTNQTSAPTAAFHSTSTLSGSGSAYSATPMLNTDGTAAFSGADQSVPNYAPSGPRRVGPPIPTGDPTPLGDALIPLLVMALAFAGIICVRRRKAKKTSV